MALDLVVTAGRLESVEEAGSVPILERFRLWMNGYLGPFHHRSLGSPYAMNLGGVWWERRSLLLSERRVRPTHERPGASGCGTILPVSRRLTGLGLFGNTSISVCIDSKCPRNSGNNMVKRGTL